MQGFSFLQSPTELAANPGGPTVSQTSAGDATIPTKLSSRCYHAAMAMFLVSPHLIDFVLALTIIEVSALLFWHHRSGSGPGLAALVGLFLPGLCLMLGLRAALAGATWPWVPLALTAALVTHLADLAARYRR